DPGLPRKRGKTPLKLHSAPVDSLAVDAAERDAILTRYREHTARFDSVAARREPAVAAVIPLQPLKELEQEPTAREIEVLQLISDGLVNREIGVRLFLSEETVKSHVRHLDRKSTRLNSSHRTISYAVFCLKKKNQKNNSK